MSLRVVLGACLLAGAEAKACDPSSDHHGTMLEIDGAPMAWIRYIPENIRVGEAFEMEIDLCDPSMKLVAVDARMPAHGHGMNYRPELAAEGGGRIRAKGFLLHMPGQWEILLNIVQGESRWRLVREVELKP